MAARHASAILSGDTITNNSLGVLSTKMQSLEDNAIVCVLCPLVAVVKA